MLPSIKDVLCSNFLNNKKITKLCIKINKNNDAVKKQQFQIIGWVIHFNRDAKLLQMSITCKSGRVQSSICYLWFNATFIKNLWIKNFAK